MPDTDLTDLRDRTRDWLKTLKNLLDRDESEGSARPGAKHRSTEKAVSALLGNLNKSLSLARKRSKAIRPEDVKKVVFNSIDTLISDKVSKSKGKRTGLFSRDPKKKSKRDALTLFKEELDKRGEQIPEGWKPQIDACLRSLRHEEFRETIDGGIGPESDFQQVGNVLATEFTALMDEEDDLADLDLRPTLERLLDPDVDTIVSRGDSTRDGFDNLLIGLAVGFGNTIPAIVQSKLEDALKRKYESDLQRLEPGIEEAGSLPALGVSKLQSQKGLAQKPVYETAKKRFETADLAFGAIKLSIETAEADDEESIEPNKVYGDAIDDLEALATLIAGYKAERDALEDIIRNRTTHLTEEANQADTPDKVELLVNALEGDEIAKLSLGTQVKLLKTMREQTKGRIDKKKSPKLFAAQCKIYSRSKMQPEFAAHNDEMRTKIVTKLKSDPKVTDAKTSWKGWGKLERQAFIKYVAEEQCKIMGHDAPTIDFIDEGYTCFKCKKPWANTKDPDTCATPRCKGYMGIKKGSQLGDKIEFNTHAEAGSFAEQLNSILHENTHSYQEYLVEKYKKAPDTLTNDERSFIPQIKMWGENQLGYMDSTSGPTYKDQPLEKHAFEFGDNGSAGILGPP